MANTLQYVIGHGEPLVKVYNNGTLHDELQFPETLLPNGTVITWKQRSLYDILQPISIDFNDYYEQLVKLNLGYWGYFTLDYENWMNNENIMNCVNKIYKYEDDGFTIQFYPHFENRRYKFFIKTIPDSELTIRMKRGGVNAIGNEGILLQFQTVRTFKYAEIQDPNAIQYYALRTNPRFCLVNS